MLASHLLVCQYHFLRALVSFYLAKCIHASEYDAVNVCICLLPKDKMFTFSFAPIPMVKPNQVVGIHYLGVRRIPRENSNRFLAQDEEKLVARWLGGVDQRRCSFMCVYERNVGGGKEGRERTT